MLRQNFGFADDQEDYDIYGTVKSDHILPDIEDEEGNFYWFFGCNDADVLDSNPSDQLTNNPNKKNKINFLANLGLFPDNEILSNKLINIYGKRVFDLIHDKSRTLDRNKSLRKRIGSALGITHADFSDSKRVDMRICWSMVKKIRALQPIDTLLNTSISDYQLKIQAVLTKVKLSISELSTELLGLDEDMPAHFKKLLIAETNELKELAEAVALLERKLVNIKNEDQYCRNKVIQEWQISLFRQMNHQFRINQGTTSLYGQSAPLARENISNSNVYTDAEYTLQEHIYQEWKPYSDEQLWLFNEDNCGNVLDSKFYAESGTKRKKLLLASCLADHADLFELNNANAISTNTIKEARVTYREKKIAIAKSSRQAKQNNKKSFVASMTKFFVPEKKDPITGLDLTSKELKRYWRSVKLTFNPDSLQNNLNTAISALQETFNAQAHTTESLISDASTVANNTYTPFSSMSNTFRRPSVVESKNDADDFLVSQKLAPTKLQYAPLPYPVAPIKEDDVLTATLNFMNNFFLFFDRDIVAKRPYLALAFFSVPFLHIALPLFASSSAVAAKLYSALLTAEANLAKYTGLNAILQATIHKQVTVASLDSATTAVREAATWFTAAEGTVEQALVGSLVAKVCFNIADLALNNPVFSDHDAALMSEYLSTVFPGLTGSLEGFTPSEKIKNIGLDILKISTQLGAAAFGIGGLEHFVQGTENILGNLANVPWDQIVHPHADIRILQTIGVSKAAGLIVFKTMGILNHIQESNLVDVDNNKLQINSAKVLDLFDKLICLSSAKRKALVSKFDAKHFSFVREHFQELLARNPELWDRYKGAEGRFTELKSLGVKKIMPKRRHKYLMGFAKTIPAIIKMGLGIVPGICVSIPGMLFRASPPTNRWVRPIYKYGIESLNMWLQVGKSAWTGFKTIVHSFAAVTLRVPEMITSILATGALVLVKPFSATAGKVVVNGFAKIGSFIREKFRYPIEAFCGKILKSFRDILVRKVEREAQALTSSPSLNSSKDALIAFQAATANIPNENKNSDLRIITSGIGFVDPQGSPHSSIMGSALGFFANTAPTTLSSADSETPEYKFASSPNSTS